ncbi:MAG: NADPH-dependent F420 reductase [Sphingomonadales bacterium]|nr:NADPH-dependent F420 reductase [Sphingomonadales bacterium]
MARIGVIGGTGHLGKAIARRLAGAGHEVTLGSRTADKAATVAGELAGDGVIVASGANAAIAAGQDVLIVTVPYAAQAATLAEIAPHIGEAILVDTTVPLVPPRVMRVQLPAAGSAALEAKALLGEGVRFVTAFHSVAAHILDTDARVDCDVLVFSDDVEARNVVIGLAQDMALRGLSGGALANSAAAEALTSILIYMNKTYGADGAGIRFTGLAKAPPIA